MGYLISETTREEREQICALKDIQITTGISGKSECI
jgi:hypothetical protein